MHPVSIGIAHGIPHRTYRIRRAPDWTPGRENWLQTTTQASPTRSARLLPNMQAEWRRRPRHVAIPSKERCLGGAAEAPVRRTQPQLLEPDLQQIPELRARRVA